MFYKELLIVIDGMVVQEYNDDFGTQENYETFFEQNTYFYTSEKTVVNNTTLTSEELINNHAVVTETNTAIDSENRSVSSITTHNYRVISNEEVTDLNKKIISGLQAVLVPDETRILAFKNIGIITDGTYTTINASIRRRWSQAKAKLDAILAEPAEDEEVLSNGAKIVKLLEVQFATLQHREFKFII